MRGRRVGTGEALCMMAVKRNTEKESLNQGKNM